MTTDIALLIRALEFAARKHRIQRRKDEDASPYINHPIALMKVLCVEAGIGDAGILSVAALHDTLEDTETTREELETEFGVEITMLVVEMTDDKSLPKAERKRLQIEHAPQTSRDGTLVGACGQGLQLARHGDEPATCVEPRAATRILRLGGGGGRATAARQYEAFGAL
jgi:guanosine-3',5'-bis(diphosphate) 3'-pyrophosphohydrolase